jgi:hypothetical protein
MGKKTAILVNIQCDNCGQLFEKKQSRIKYSKHHYCCLECSDEHKKKTMKGKNNHRYGIKHTDERKKKTSAAMKKLWKDDNYVEKVLSSRKKTAESRDTTVGWDEESRNKRISTFRKKFGVEHNWSSAVVREKCEQTTIERYGKSSLELASDNMTCETYEKRRRTLIETMTGISYGAYMKKLSGKEKYYKNVRRLTEQQPLHLLENYEKRGRSDLCENPYHLDHIIPICYGWLNDIPEEIIADISNLRFIPACDNISKSSYYENKIWRESEEI